MWSRASVTILSVRRSFPYRDKLHVDSYRTREALGQSPRLAMLASARMTPGRYRKPILPMKRFQRHRPRKLTSPRRLKWMRVRRRHLAPSRAVPQSTRRTARPTHVRRFGVCETVGFTAGGALLNHNPNPNFVRLRWNNTLCCDTAATVPGTLPPPWSAGTWDWRIPTRYRCFNSTGAGNIFTRTLQQFRINAAGRVTVSKQGATVSRNP